MTTDLTHIVENYDFGAITNKPTTIFSCHQIKLWLPHLGPTCFIFVLASVSQKPEAEINNTVIELAFEKLKSWFGVNEPKSRKQVLMSFYGFWWAEKLKKLLQMLIEKKTSRNIAFGPKAKNYS